MTEERRRLRELGIEVGRFATGPFNAITDVAGVMVGHTTLIEGAGPLVQGVGPVRTGVTAIVPNGHNIFTERLIGGAFILNGAGELSGLIQVQEWGILETPILLTNTLSVGTVAGAMVEYMLDRYPGIGVDQDVVIPLVGECDDSFLNDIRGQHVDTDHVWQALESATSGPVTEGSVGGGTGMISFDLKGGIGTSSRRLPEEHGSFTVGVLVMSNYGRLEDLRIDGLPIGRELVEEVRQYQKRVSLYGSIIAVVATDAPLMSHQIGRLCKRVALGIGRVGSYAAHGSGEIILGFSTANAIPRVTDQPVHNLTVLVDRLMDPLYIAAIECTEEAVLNAMCMATTLDGVDGRLAPAMPLERVAEIWQRYHGGGPRPSEVLPPHETR